MKLENILLEQLSSEIGVPIKATFILLDHCCYIWIGIANNKNGCHVMGNLSVGINFGTTLPSTNNSTIQEPIVQCLFDSSIGNEMENVLGDIGEGIANRLLRNKYVTDLYKQVFVSYNISESQKLSTVENVDWERADLEIERHIREYLLNQPTTIN
jgi:hypothetical protein